MGRRDNCGEICFLDCCEYHERSFESRFSEGFKLLNSAYEIEAFSEISDPNIAPHIVDNPNIYFFQSINDSKEHLKLIKNLDL